MGILKTRALCISYAPRKLKKTLPTKSFLFGDHRSLYTRPYHTVFSMGGEESFLST